MFVVSSPNPDRTLLTLPELRSAAGVSDARRDPELIALGGYVAATITNACNVDDDGMSPPTLRLESVTETFRYTSTFHSNRIRNNRRQSGLLLSRYPVMSIASVTATDTPLTFSTDYECQNSVGILYRLSNGVRIPWSWGTIVVAYSAGFAVVPDDLKYAAIKFVQYQLQLGDRDPFLQMKETVGVSTYRWHESHAEPNIPAHVMDILQTGGYVQTWGVE